jgi:hypothetical protein
LLANSLERHVHITSWISGDEVRREIPAVRALVLPRYTEDLRVALDVSAGDVVKLVRAAQTCLIARERLDESG